MENLGGYLTFWEEILKRWVDLARTLSLLFLLTKKKKRKAIVNFWTDVVLLKGDRKLFLLQIYNSAMVENVAPGYKDAILFRTSGLEEH